MICDNCGQELRLTLKQYLINPFKIRCSKCGDKIDLRMYDKLSKKISHLNFINIMTVVIPSLIVRDFLKERCNFNYWIFLVIWLVLVVIFSEIINSIIFLPIYRKIVLEFFDKLPIDKAKAVSKTPFANPTKDDADGDNMRTHTLWRHFMW